MEELLKYSLYKLAVLILILEVIILGGFALAIFIVKYVSDLNKNREKENRAALSELIMRGLKGEKGITVPEKLRGFKNMVVTLESFNNRLTDSDWVKIRDKMIDDHLIEKARQNVFSKQWTDRQLAARCFLLNPAKARDEDLATLLDDPKYLVRVVAAAAIVKRSNRKLFERVVRKMAAETPLSRYAYRDPLMNGDAEKFRWLEEMAKEEKDPEVCAICLDLLSTRTTSNLFPLAESFVYNGNSKCKLEAIKILKSLPGEPSKDILTHCLSDADWEVRAEGAKALAIHRAGDKASHLQKLLSDHVWFVRLQAALALKEFGGEGMKLLSSQHPEKNPQAYEIAKYVLSLP